jgi:hypothetical protein
MTSGGTAVNTVGYAESDDEQSSTARTEVTTGTKRATPRTNATD